MGSVYKVDWSHKCLSPGGKPRDDTATLGSGKDGRFLCERQPAPLQVLPRQHMEAAPASPGDYLLFLVHQSNIRQWMRNPDTLQEVVEERVAAGDGGFTLKLPRTVARCNLYNCSLNVDLKVAKQELQRRV